MPVVFSHAAGGRALLRFIANATVNVAANSTVNSDLGFTPSNDAITGASITKLAWSTANNITIARGSNTILTLSGTGHWDLRQMGTPLTEFPAATLVVTLRDANSSLLVEMSKYYAASVQNPDSLGH